MTESEVWTIRSFDGTQCLWEIELPGYLYTIEIEQLLKRLAARHLSETEVALSSLRRSNARRVPLLDLVGSNREIQTNGTPFYVARRAGSKSALGNQTYNTSFHESSA